MFSLTPFRKSQPKTFSNQAKLPRLPVPALETSLDGYLKSLVPVLEQKASPPSMIRILTQTRLPQYDASSLPREIEKRKIIARDFGAPDGLGRVLQERLKDLDHVSPNNWLNDTLWLPLAYHTWRAPLLINSNWWLLFKPDPLDPPPPSVSSLSTTPDPSPSQAVEQGSQGGGKSWLAQKEKREKVDYDEVVEREPVTDWQIQKAAWVVSRFAEFRSRLLREEILPDSSKAGPFCMSQYQKLFNISRIPLLNSDAFSAQATHASHITLLVDDFLYSIDVFASTPVGEVAQPLAVGEIAARLKAAVEDAKQRKANGEKGIAVGVLTADERDTWMKNREHLLSLSASNRNTFDSISSSLLALSLDSYTIPSVSTSDPLKLPAVDAQIRNCASGIDGGHNRWFDKALSVMMETNGRAGIMGEHSPVDALIPSIVVDYVLGEPVDMQAFQSSTSKATTTGWKREDWVVDEAVENGIMECQERNKKLIGDSDASQLWWGEYGAEWIKKVAKQSPDAYLQQALQLAWYIDQGYATATYETASTRMMLHGRTDVIRSLSSESRAFVMAMLNAEYDAKKNYDLLSKATTAHNLLTKTSSAGHGFDRHLMGLKTRLREGESHEFFDDDMYAKSQEWKLSTSGLSAGHRFMGTGFGAAWPDGYGINYLAGPFLIKFGIESKFSCDKTSTSTFKHNIVESLRMMREVCESVAAGDDEVKARL
ncbi:hypothetical protein P7C73_g2745, partial [Tremellales sp. Uapishka_1]